jgi:hypothetical protein
LLDYDHVGLGEVVAGADHFEVDGGIGFREGFGELMRLLGRADWVDFPAVDLDDCPSEIESFDGSGEEHGTEEDGLVKWKCACEEEVGGDVRAVTIAEGDGLPVFEFGTGFEPNGEFLGAKGEVVVVELALGESGKVAVHAVFLNFSANTENAYTGGKVFEEVGELVFVTSGAVEGEDDWLGWIARGVEKMEVRHVSSGILLR